MNALTNSVSIIEGPPGTGKTQTILNLLSNLVGYRNLKVAMVSGTNEAVRNVSEKFNQEGYGFLLANLGNKDKQKAFFSNLPQADLAAFVAEEDTIPLETMMELSRLFLKEREMAQNKQQLSAYQLEQEHFNHYYEAQDYQSIEDLSVSKLPADKIVKFLAETQLHVLQDKKSSIFYKLTLFVKYRFKEFAFMRQEETRLVLEVQSYYYQAKITELESLIRQLESELKHADFSEKRKKYQENSRKIFRTEIVKRYSKMSKPDFTINSYKKDFYNFTSHFPIILSTTFSLKNCIPQGYLFDYLIIDESSQVDLLSGVLVLSCCKHVVIVGDKKQLPPIADESIREKLAIQCPNDSYNYFKHSILSSVKDVYSGQAAIQLLREHYRCEPAIIQFCNQRYYDGELIVMKDASEKTPLILCLTSAGNHMRTINNGKNNGKYNQRELDTILAEILTDPEKLSADIGFTTPYVRQARKALEQMPKELECDTIHKYQGRQKKIMILSTVLSNTRNGHMGLRFVDDPNKINVAVSRAERQFILVTDKSFFSDFGKELKSLIGYMEYQLLDVELIESKVVSVFDLLYKDYSDTLLNFGSRLPEISIFKSENIIYGKLKEILEEPGFHDFTFAFQILLKNLIIDVEKLSDRERKYINNRASIDFLIYRKVNKAPVFAIEVDGFDFHENKPVQQERDLLKNHILVSYQIPLLRLKTNGSGEEQKIREMLIKYG